MASVISVRIKIADFGCSKYDKGTELRTGVGTQFYMAPELHGLGEAREKYTNAIDMWALGCIIYEMLISTPIFSQLPTSTDNTTSITTISGTTNKKPIFDHNLLWMFYLGGVAFHIEKLQQAQASSKAIEQSLLCVVPEERLTAASSLQAPWIIEESGPTPDLTILAAHTEDPLSQVVDYRPGDSAQAPWIIEEDGPTPDLIILAAHTEDPVSQLVDYRRENSSAEVLCNDECRGELL